jgi:hypothetical protein
MRFVFHALDVGDQALESLDEIFPIEDLHARVPAFVKRILLNVAEIPSTTCFTAFRCSSRKDERG